MKKGFKDYVRNFFGGLLLGTLSLSATCAVERYSKIPNQNPIPNRKVQFEDYKPFSRADKLYGWGVDQIGNNRLDRTYVSWFDENAYKLFSINSSLDEQDKVITFVPPNKTDNVDKWWKITNGTERDHTSYAITKIGDMRTLCRLEPDGSFSQIIGLEYIDEIEPIDGGVAVTSSCGTNQNIHLIRNDQAEKFDSPAGDERFFDFSPSRDLTHLAFSYSDHNSRRLDVWTKNDSNWIKTRTIESAEDTSDGFMFMSFDPSNRYMAFRVYGFAAKKVMIYDMERDIVDEIDSVVVGDSESYGDNKLLWHPNQPWLFYNRKQELVTDFSTHHVYLRKVKMNPDGSHTSPETLFDEKLRGPEHLQWGDENGRILLFVNGIGLEKRIWKIDFSD